MTRPSPFPNCAMSTMKTKGNEEFLPVIMNTKPSLSLGQDLSSRQERGTDNNCFHTGNNNDCVRTGPEESREDSDTFDEIFKLRACVSEEVYQTFAQEQENKKIKDKRRREAYTADNFTKNYKHQDKYNDTEKNRINVLYELGKSRITVNRELAANNAPKNNEIILNIESAGNSRVHALYELGKSRVTDKRELASMKLKIDSVNLNVESIRTSDRITALYELGKSRVMINRELAATKLRTIDDLEANIATLSDKKMSASEIAGLRLYTQALLSAERKEKMRQVAKAAQPPQMKLAAHHGKPLYWGSSATERFFALYEHGKNRVTADRKLETKASVTKSDLSNEGMIAEYASTRQTQLYEMGKKKLLNEKLNKKPSIVLPDEIMCAGDANPRQLQLYEMGKRRLINNRLHAQKETDILDDDVLSSQLLEAIVANPTMVKLYEMSKDMQENGKVRREEIICGKKGKNEKNKMSSHPVQVMSPNTTMTKLYALSTVMQEHGKERRDEIVHSKINYPIMKV